MKLSIVNHDISKLSLQARAMLSLYSDMKQSERIEFVAQCTRPESDIYWMHSLIALEPYQDEENYDW